MFATRKSNNTKSNSSSNHVTSYASRQYPLKRAYQVGETQLEHGLYNNNNNRINDTRNKSANNSESITTSSDSSTSVYTQNGAQNSTNNNGHYYATSKHAAYLQSQAAHSMMGADLSPMVSAASASSDVGQHRRHQLAMRAPMMIDGDDDDHNELGVDGVGLIDDDDIVDDEPNNNISAFFPHSHPHLHSHNTYSSHHNYHHHHNHHLHHIGDDCVDSTATTTADGFQIDPHRTYSLQAHRNNDTTANGNHFLSSQPHRHVTPFARPQQQQVDHRLAGGDYVTNSPKSFVVAPTQANTNSYSSKQYPAPVFNRDTSNNPYPFAVYHQPNLGQHVQQSQQYHSLSTYQQQSQQYSYPQIQHPFATTTTTKQAHLLSTSSINNRQVVEKSSQNSNSNSSSSATSVALIKKESSSKSQKGKNSKKMQSSRQHIASPDPHHHHQRHLHSSSKRKAGGGGSASSRQQTPSKLAAISVANKVAQDKPALGCCGKIAKLLLFITNILFWSSGIALGAWGILSLVDDHKNNLSQLLVFEPNSRMSLFQLLSWSFITLGCATILVGFCGCSAILKNNRWILGLYIFLILAIFALDLATGLLAIIFQERLVANVRLRLVNKLRSEYGVQASFTAAIDYIQTKYECCGLEGHFDYDQSLWRLQRLGGFEATVARTCCHLLNTFDDQAHINPRPMNESLCQSTDSRFHQSFRYRKGCLDDLERLVRQKIWTFTIGCGAVGGIILLSLIFATCFCRSIAGQSSRKNSSDREQQQLHSNHHDKKQKGGKTMLAQQTDAQLTRHYR